MAGKPGRSGAPAGNLNNLRNGSKLCRVRLVIGQLPAKYRTAQKQARSYRRKIIEGLQEGKGGELDSLDLHLVDLGAQCTAEESILRQVLRDRHDKMKPGEIAGLLKQIRESKKVRLDALTQLRDLCQPPDPWEQLYSAPETEEEDENGQEA